MRRSFTSVLFCAGVGLLLGTSTGFAKDKVPKTSKNPVVLIKTSLGLIKAELYADRAPITVQNFLQYADDKFYDGTIFHRVIRGFMIQGGGFSPAMTEKPARSPIKNEASAELKNEVGTLAMARTSDPNSASAQFFINTADNSSHLDHNQPPGSAGYAVFGKVIDGLPVVMKISEVKTAMKGGMSDVPEKPVLIESIRRNK